MASTHAECCGCPRQSYDDKSAQAIFTASAYFFRRNLVLIPENTVLLLVDIQEKLSAAMIEKQALVDNAIKMVNGARVLGVPIIRTEQNPNGLGKTVPELEQLLRDEKPITKLSFSCCGEPRFMEKLHALNRGQVLIGGIESHVCVYQTVLDLLSDGYEVQVLADAVSSRTEANRTIGLERCRLAGATVTSIETALFEMLRVAEGDKFKQMLKVVK
jgi:nicotinamidase-related amidase